MNFLQIGETWVDMDRVYQVMHTTYRDRSGEDAQVYALYFKDIGETTTYILEANAAPLLAWLDAHKAKPVTGLPEGFPELTQEQAEKIAEAFQAFKDSGAWELLKK